MAQDLQQQVDILNQKIQTLEAILANHQHVLGDGTQPLRKSIILDRDQWLATGHSQVITGNPQFLGTANEFYGLSISEGPDSVTQGVLYKSQNLQMDFLHYPNTDTSFVQLSRKPLVACNQGTTVSVSSGGSSVTIDGYAFATNELAGGVIWIQDSGGNYLEAHLIASNTATSVTITGTWANTASGCTFGIYRPVYFGTAETILQRIYVQESTAGGIRFGMGPTAGGQNGLLYMDAAGDLYWRSKAGTSTKLN